VRIINMLGGASGIRPCLGVSNHHDSGGACLSFSSRCDQRFKGSKQRSPTCTYGGRNVLYTYISYPRHAKLGGWCIVLQANVHGASRFMQPAQSQGACDRIQTVCLRVDPNVPYCITSRCGAELGPLLVLVIAPPYRRKTRNHFCT
jgi:hypothetical protein